MNTLPIPVVLIGCGAVSQMFYAPSLSALEEVGELNVVGLVDPFAPARASGEAAFPKARSTDRMADVNAPPGALAIIATPPRFHADLTEEALQRGWHVLCEKPMASTANECERMIACAKAAERLLAVGLYKRFFPSSRLIREILQSGQLGALQSFSIEEGGPFKWPAVTTSFFSRKQTPGGVLFDIGVHVLDLLGWWLGEPDSFHYADDAIGGLEANAVLTLEYASGVRGSVRLSLDWTTANEYRFHFEHGMVIWHVNEASRISIQLAGTHALLDAQLMTGNAMSNRPLASNPQSFIEQLRNILAAIRGDEPLLVSGEEGMRSLRLIEACYSKRNLLEQPWLSKEETLRIQELVTLQ